MKSWQMGDDFIVDLPNEANSGKHVFMSAPVEIAGPLGDDLM
jgi:hypothetical protein